MKITRHIKSYIATWAAIAERLQRRGVMVGVAMALMLGLIEPLACVIHCDIQSLLASLQQNQVQMPGHMHHMAQADSHATLVSQAALCPFQQNHSSPTGTNWPQPFHEMLLFTLIIVLAVTPHRSCWQHIEQTALFIRPIRLLRPPIVAA